MFFVHRSNRTEHLVEALAHIIRTRPLADPLIPECIVVEGRGIESWLARALADQLGLWANARFPFPRHFLRQCFRAVLGAEEVQTQRFEPEALAWSVAALLPTLRHEPAFAAIHAYLARDESPARLVALSQHIARLLDQYVTYRPDMIAAWETGADDHWQAQLWRRLTAELSAPHVAACARRFVAGVGTAAVSQLPRRVFLFGLSTLPQLYLEVLNALAATVPVHLFILSPSEKYWGDIRSRRETLRALRSRSADDVDIDAQIEALAVNPLLASLGSVGRDFQALLESTCDYVDAEDFAAPGAAHGQPATVLSTLQSDILELRPRRAHSERLTWNPDDASVQLHRCHSPMREVQVLHDRLLQGFEQDSTLGPDDVIVLCPAIDDYAPFIDAVFGVRGDGVPIPHRIADRKLRSDQAAIDAFLRVLAALDGRLTAVEVVDLLELPPLRERFGIAEADVERLGTWIGDAGVRWGIDAEHRAAAGQPELSENTWRFGLERLFLGFALAPIADRPFAGRLPAGEIEGSAATLLGGLAEFHATLAHWREAVRAPRPLAQWLPALEGCLVALIADAPETQPQRQRIRDAIANIEGGARDAAFAEEIDLATLRTLIEQEIERSAPGRGFASGGVTFCALVPMRSVPYRVVCLLGMNDDAFPRKDRKVAFDLIANRPRPGDRSVRADDRYLFLEALLAARDRLILTCVGRGVRDNAVLPPAVVVSELFDAIDDTFEGPKGYGLVSAALVVDHPLQPFSPRYFDRSDPQLFSYAASHFAGAQALTRPANERAPFVFVRGALADAGESPSPSTLESLCRFLQNPARALLRERLGIFLHTDDGDLGTREPIELDALEAWAIGNDIVERGRRSAAPPRAAELFRAEGRLPPGTIGDVTYAHIEARAQAIAAQAREVSEGAPLAAVPFEVELAGVPIVGTLRDLWPTGQVRAVYSALDGKAWLDLWVRHLFLNLIQPAGCARQSFLIGRGEKDQPYTMQELRPIDEAEALLENLVTLHRRGRTIPVPLFARASFAYVGSLARYDEARARRDARVAFIGDGYRRRGDADDPAVRLVFGSDEPLPIDPDFPLYEPDEFSDLRFEAVSQAVFGPLFAMVGEPPAEVEDDT